MVLNVVLFIAGLICLIKGGDWFVDGATGIAKKFNVPELLIGATVVSIGTTLPEVMVSATSAATGHSAMAYGNAIGSIICNTALVAAITVAIKPAVVARKSLIVPVVFFFLAAFLFAGNAYITGAFTRPIGFVLLAVFVIYMIILIRQAISGNASEDSVEEAEEEKEKPMWLVVVLLVVGAALIAVGAKLLVDNGTEIAKALGVPETVIALTFVALGTSLPELVTAITSLAKGHGALSLGNVIGANLFNLVLVSGLSISINGFSLYSDVTANGLNPEFSPFNLGGKAVPASLVIDTPLMLLVMAILVLPVLVKQKLYRWQGILLLCLYAGFCVFQFI